MQLQESGHPTCLSHGGGMLVPASAGPWPPRGSLRLNKPPALLLPHAVPAAAGLHGQRIIRAGQRRLRAGAHNGGTMLYTAGS